MSPSVLSRARVGCLLYTSQRGQRVARVETAGDGQVGQQGGRLARVRLKGLAVAFKAGGTEEM